MRTKILVVVIAGFTIGALVSTQSPLSLIQEISTSDSDKVLYNIDTEEEWQSQSGAAWTTDATSFSEGKFEIERYGVYHYPDFASAASYRTYSINASGDPIQLKKLEAKGHIGDSGHESGLAIRIFDCEKPLGPENSLEEVCDPNEVYRYGLRRTAKENIATIVEPSSVDSQYALAPVMDPGPIEVQREFSNVTVEGYLSVTLAIATNSTQPVPANQTTYWDSIKLTAER